MASSQEDLDTDSLAILEKLQHKRRVRFPRWGVLMGALLYYLVLVQILAPLWSSPMGTDKNALVQGAFVGAGYLFAFLIVGDFGNWNYSWWFATDPKGRNSTSQVSHALLAYHQKLQANPSSHHSIYSPEEERIVSRLKQRIPLRTRFLKRGLIASCLMVAMIFPLGNPQGFADLLHVAEKDSFALGLLYAFMSGAILLSPIPLILHLLKLDLWAWEKHENLLLKSHAAWQTQK